ncbi:M81 family metallopeptidase (plasmid) [Diaphorobacter sp. HDW4B]|uniref:M81 family metallopeptidase n=1 Tax=Diaphorobacter sp. HDW4B TaxID=2714925 RepID=UPI001408F6AA|nr:M81 family metallopeptidase [Diaphorobacter sp. HDW4B]QIL73925.1 M81 family metallopeptidase [Diaphorobacter sp. HDW4B]
MKFLLATIKHETNTFSPVPTDVARFSLGEDVPIQGERAAALRRGTGTAMGGYIEVLEAYGIEFDVAVVAEARPSGPVQQQAFDAITDPVIAALSAGCYSAVLLDLHGAMVTVQFDDAETELLQRIRSVVPNIPIGMTLDMHANVSVETVKLATVLTGYHTYPHVDAKDAGARAARLLVSAVQGTTKPRLAWCNAPMLPHVMRQGTYSGPNQILQSACIRLEQQGVALAASVFTGFPHADIEGAGLSVVVCCDDDPLQAGQLAEHLCLQAWELRHDFVFEGTPLVHSLDQAAAAKEFPVVVLDHCDNASSGGTMDTTVVLAEVLKRNLDRAVFFAIHDPDVVQQAIATGKGSVAVFSLGGKHQNLATGEPNPPLEVRARVKTISDGKVILHGPMMAGMAVNMGPTVVLQCDDVDIVVVSNHVEPSDRSYFSTLGFDVLQMKFLILKSRVHWRAGFGDLARTVVEADGIGVTGSDYTKFNYRKVRRPIFPLDSSFTYNTGDNQ